MMANLNNNPIKLNYFYVFLISLILIIGSVPVLKYAYRHFQHKKSSFTEVFLKNLNSNNAIEQVKKIKIKFKGETFTIIAAPDGNWLIEEKGNYPVLGAKIKELIWDLADLKVVESKTAKPENFAELEVEDLSINNNTTFVQLLDINGKEIEGIYIGKREFIASANADYKAHIFVRRVNEKQAWLVLGKLPEGFTFKDLVRQPLFNIDLASIAQVELNKTQLLQNSSIKIARNPTTKELTLLDVSPRYKVKEQYVIENIVQQFSYLNYDDVIVGSEEASPVLKGKITLLPNPVEPKKTPATAYPNVSTDNSNVPAVKEEPKEQVINFELVYLNKSYYLKINDLAPINSNWLYKISDYACQSLLVNKKDLLTEAGKGLEKK